MITKPTVFIFGAGVSMPYGFPSGKALLNRIHQTTKATISDLSNEKPNLHEIGQMLREEFGEKEVMEFGNELYLSQQTSIDAFLEHRPEFIKIGKTAIALCLARMENEEKLFSMEVRDKGCYQYLFHKMNSDWDTFTENKIAFITFNYDRSLEEYFFTALKYTYGKTDEECASLISQIPIVHVHGSLGPLPWQSPKGIPYTSKYISISGGNIFSGQYREWMRDNIIVISEGQDESQEFQRASELLHKASNIYFLGFGYHPTNLRRLLIQETSGTIRGSTMEMEEAEVISAAQHVITYTEVRRKYTFPDNTSDSLLFLRKYVDFS